MEAAQGLWTCIPHLVRDHPIFAGLPTGGMMRGLYDRVSERVTYLVKLNLDRIVTDGVKL